MRGRLVVIALALVAIVVAFSARGGNDDKGGARTTAGASADALQLTFVHSTEKAALIKRLVDGFNAAHVRSRRRGSCTSGRSSVASGDAETRIAAGRLAGRVVAGVVALGPPAELRRRQRLMSPRQPVARPHAARHRDVGDVRARARLAEAAGRLEQILRLAQSPKGWALYGKPGFPAVQARPHEPRLLDERAVGRRGRVLRGDGQARGPHAGRRRRGPRCAARSAAIERSIVHYGDTTLFFSDQLLRYGPALRAGRRDGGDDAHRLQPAARQPRAARGALPEGRHVLLRQPGRDRPRAVGHAPAARRRRGVLAWSCQRDHAPVRGPRRLPARRPDAKPARRSTARTAPTRRSRRSRSRSRSRRVLARDQDALARGPQAGQRDARRRHVGVDERGGQDGAGQARPAVVPRPARAPGPRRADHFSDEGPAGAADRAASPAPRRTSPRRWPASPTARRRSTTRRSPVYGRCAALDDTTRINAVVLLTDGMNTTGRGPC